MGDRITNGTDYGIKRPSSGFEYQERTGFKHSLHKRTECRTERERPESCGIVGDLMKIPPKDCKSEKVTEKPDGIVNLISFKYVKYTFTKCCSQSDRHCRKAKSIDRN